MLISSLCACSRVTPGARWPNTCSCRALRFCCSRFGIGAERQPEIGVERELEALRHHADDRRRHVVDAHGAADHRRVAAVAVQPHAVADEHHRRRAGAIVVRQRSRGRAPALCRGCRSALARHVRAVEALGRLAFVADVGDGAGVGAESMSKVRVVVAPVAEIEVRHAHAAVADAIGTNRSAIARSGSAIGRPRISTAFTKVNTVALTPMPSASATAATSVNHLSFRSRRAANRTSSQRPMVCPSRQPCGR